MPVFYAKRLTLAREYAGINRKALAQELELSAQSITHYEEGERIPTPDVVQRIAFRLGFAEAFFYAGPIDLPGDAGVSFRSRYSLKAANRNKARATGALAHEIISPRLHKRFEMPALDVPDLSMAKSPEEAARLLRDAWQLGLGPIHNMVHLLESKGVEVYWTGEPVSNLDAFCLWRDGVPFVLLNQHTDAGERARFDAAHELAHLVLHRHVVEVDGPQIEAEANQFAAAFLLPADQFKFESPRLPAFNEYLRLKTRWKVSIQTMIRRGRDLGVFDDWYYEKAFKQLSINGWRTTEPGRIPREHSLLHKMAFDSMAAKKETPEDFARSLHLPAPSLFVIMPTAQEYLPKPEKASGGKVYTVNNVTLRLTE